MISQAPASIDLNDYLGIPVDQIVCGDPSAYLILGPYHCEPWSRGNERVLRCDILHFGGETPLFGDS